MATRIGYFGQHKRGGRLFGQKNIKFGNDTKGQNCKIWAGVLCGLGEERPHLCKNWISAGFAFHWPNLRGMDTISVCSVGDFNPCGKDVGWWSTILRETCNRMQSANRISTHILGQPVFQVCFHVMLKPVVSVFVHKSLCFLLALYQWNWIRKELKTHQYFCVIAFIVWRLACDKNSNDFISGVVGYWTFWERKHPLPCKKILSIKGMKTISLGLGSRPIWLLKMISVIFVVE